MVEADYAVVTHPSQKCLEFIRENVISNLSIYTTLSLPVTWSDRSHEERGSKGWLSKV